MDWKYFFYKDIIAIEGSNFWRTLGIEKSAATATDIFLFSRLLHYPIIIYFSFSQHDGMGHRPNVAVLECKVQ